MRNLVIAGAATALVVACASTPGATPQDMSVAQHEAMAKRLDNSAAAHAGDPKQTDSRRMNCTGQPATGGGLMFPCWSDDDTADAEKHRKMAADHRAAAKALRDAEAQACAGLSDADRDMSPFHHRADILSVEPLLSKAVSSRDQYTKREGAIVTFRAVPGLTAEWLQRIVDCHVARNAALGNDVPEMPYCPLVPKGVHATVSSVRGGFAIAIRADDVGGAEDVLRRANALVAH